MYNIKNMTNNNKFYELIQIKNKSILKSHTLSLTLYNPNHQCQNVLLNYGTPMDSIL